MTPIQRYSAPILLALTLVAAGVAHSSHAQNTERRLEPYGCVLRLPSPEFTWLEKDDIPGATLACRDTSDRFVILVVAEAPRGFRIDARQGAAFEKGMDRQPNIERLGSKLTEFLGVPCYEIRGRLKADQSLTLTRFFAANGFLYNLQAMIPATPDGESGKFDDLFAAFQFTGSTPVAGTSGTTATAVSAQATTAPIPPAFAPPATAGTNRDVQPPSEVQASPNLSRAAPTQAPLEGGLPQAREPSSRTRFWVTALIAGSGLGVICCVMLLRLFRNGP